MRRAARWGVVGAIILSALGVVLAKEWSRPAPPERSAPQQAGVPRLVDLGAGACIPCKAMAPILAQLREDYTGRMTVEFIDVWKNPPAASVFGIHTIPTQIFYAADGRELYRHEGFISREEILGQWKSLGVDL